MTVSFDSSSGISYRGSTETSIHNLVNTTSCTLYAPLASALTLSKGTGNPTWSRTTKAWGFNELGYLEELASGCAFFDGARLIRNLATVSSESFLSGYGATNLAITSANLVTCSATTSTNEIINNGAPLATSSIGYLYRFTWRVQYVDIQYVQIAGHSSSFGTAQFANFDLVGNTANATGCTASITNVSTGVYDLVVVFTGTAVSATVAAGLCLVPSLTATRKQAFVGDGVKTLGVLRYSVVDVTGYASSYVPEYVSVGVVSSPFFGAGIDGAKYFSTDYTKSQALPNLSGLRIEAAATNNILNSRNLDAPDTGNNIPVAWVAQTTGSSLVTNGTFDSDVSGWTGGAAWEAGTARIVGLKTVYQNLSLTVGKTYQVTANISVVAGSSYSISIKRDGNFVKWQTVTTPSFLYSVTSEGAYQISFFVNTGVTIDIDNVVVKECTIFVSPAIGLDGIDNTATTLTATATDATILQSTTIASAARCASAYVKRRTGTGTISFTQDGGSSWTNITSLINSSTWARVEITSTLANPSVGFKISTSEDAIAVDCVQNEAGTVATSPIVTTTATVTRNADSLTYQTASNWSDTAGTAVIEVQPYVWSVGGLVGSATNGLLKSGSNSGATSYDGTNAANGPTGTPSGRKKLAMSWGNSEMTVASDGIVGTPGTYDGAMGLSSIGIGVGSVGYFGPITIYDFAMNDAELKVITS